MDYLISCDWFQYCCANVSGYIPDLGSRLISDAHDDNGERLVFDVVAPKEIHSIYTTSVTISHKGIDVAHVHYNPSSSAIPAHYCAVKVANRLLYSGVWSLYLHAVVRALRLVINNITRLDLCLDFQKFANDMLPYDFMRTYLQDSAKGETTYIRKHSNQFTLVASKIIKSDNHPCGTTYASDSKKIKMHGHDVEVGFDEGEVLHSCSPFFQTIRWGSRQSAVMVEMYNKSKELHDKKHKPYISALWQECGLIQSPDLPIYRIEISITSKGLGYQEYSSVKVAGAPDKETFSKLEAQDIDNQGKLEQVFWAYAAEYFSFYEYRSSCRWRKDMPIVQLFPRECIETPILKPRTINRSHDTGRSERLAASTFERLTTQLIDLPEVDTSALRHVAGLLSQIGALKSARHLAVSKEEQRAVQEQAFNDYCDALADERGKCYDAEVFNGFGDALRNGEYNNLIHEALTAVEPHSNRPAWSQFRIKAAIDVLMQELGAVPNNLGGVNSEHNKGNVVDNNRLDSKVAEDEYECEPIISEMYSSDNSPQSPPF